MKSQLASAGLVVVLALVPSIVSAGDRLSDKDVKALLETLDNSRDRFEDQLDGKLKSGIVRGPRGEVNVRRYLDDLQENVKRLRERYTGGYAASAEVSTLLKQGSEIHRFMKTQPQDLKGMSEWDRLAGDLTSLATAYGTAFPLEGDAAVRRISDQEAASAAEKVAKQTDALKKAFNSDKTIAKPDKEKVKTALDMMKKQANAVKSRTAGGKPATEPWSALQGGVTTLRQAFGITP